MQPTCSHSRFELIWIYQIHLKHMCIIVIYPCGGSTIAQRVTLFKTEECMSGKVLGVFRFANCVHLQIHWKRALCFVFRQYRAAAALSHLATRDIMAALKATVLCVAGSRGGGRWRRRKKWGWRSIPSYNWKLSQEIHLSWGSNEKRY